MKTKTLLLLCFFLALGLIQGYGQKSIDRDEYTMLGEPAPLQDKMNGKVQEVVLKFYWGTGSGDNMTKGKHITTRERDSLGWFYDFEATFDNIGDHMMTFNHLDDNNQAITRYQFIRENNRIVLSKWSLGKEYNWGFGNYSRGDGYTKYVYDDKGELTGKADYQSDGDVLLYTFQIKNDEAGNPIEVKALDGTGNFLAKWSTVYNEKQQDTEGDWTDKNGNIAGSYTAVYNDKGKVTEITNYDKDKKVTMVHTYAYPEYDAMGNWIKVFYKNNIGQMVYCERSIKYF